MYNISVYTNDFSTENHHNFFLSVNGIVNDFTRDRCKCVYCRNDFKIQKKKIVFGH